MQRKGITEKVAEIKDEKSKIARTNIMKLNKSNSIYDIEITQHSLNVLLQTHHFVMITIIVGARKL